MIQTHDGETFVFEEDNRATRIRISREVDGRRIRVRLRLWYLDDDGEWRPGKPGIEFKSRNAAAVIGGILNAVSPK